MLQYNRADSLTQYRHMSNFCHMFEFRLLCIGVEPNPIARRFGGRICKFMEIYIVIKEFKYD